MTRRFSVEGILANSAKALDLESGLDEAHASRGFALSVTQRCAEAEQEFERAIETDPNLFKRITSMRAPAMCRESSSRPRSITSVPPLAEDPGTDGLAPGGKAGGLAQRLAGDHGAGERHIERAQAGAHGNEEPGIGGFMDLIRYA